jgi:hypothetical protein
MASHAVPDGRPYLCSVAADEPEQVQAELDKHLPSGSDGKCLACGQEIPCSAKWAELRLMQHGIRPNLAQYRCTTPLARLCGPNYIAAIALHPKVPSPRCNDVAPIATAAPSHDPAFRQRGVASPQPGVHPTEPVVVQGNQGPVRRCDRVGGAHVRAAPADRAIASTPSKAVR